MNLYFRTFLTILGVFWLPFLNAVTVNGPAGSGVFGSRITVLPNGNYVVCDPQYDDGAIKDVGAVYLYNGKTHALISTLKGSTTKDFVGSFGVVVLPSGNFLVRSIEWNNGSATRVGAVTWVNGSTGLNGTVSSSNSMVGSSTNDVIGYTVKVLTNGNYLIVAPTWDNGAAINAGAVAWGNGSSGTSGVVSALNAMVGASSYDKVGEQEAGGESIFALPNGHYLVLSPMWNNGAITDAGAATWGNGNSGTTGVIDSTNSLVGSRTNDKIGIHSYYASGGACVLTNGNYVVISPYWNDGNFQMVGAVTWGNGNAGISGIVSSSNSLVGDTTGDYIGGSGVTALSNGHYVVNSWNWDNGTLQDAGASTWCNGNTGRTGIVGTSNSLYGTRIRSYVGSHGATALSNGHYVVISPSWGSSTNGLLGAATWCDGTSGRTGAISAANSLVGSNSGDVVAYGGVLALPNGHYVVNSYEWDNGTALNAGAITWCNGTTGRTGTISSSNSLVGNTQYDGIGSHNNSNSVFVLPNGNYVVVAPGWHLGNKTVGAVIWCNSNTGRTGSVSAANALTGSSDKDYVGSMGITILSNGHYVVRSPVWNNGSVILAGAVTWCNGNSGLVGVVSATNSLVGEQIEDNIGEKDVVALKNGHYVVLSDEWAKGSSEEVGAITWCNGNGGTVGVVNGLNSLLGRNRSDFYYSRITALSNGDYAIESEVWDNGDIGDAGAVTYANGNKGLSGSIDACNSVLGFSTAKGKDMEVAFDSAYNYMLVGLANLNKIEIFDPYTQSLAEHLDTQYNLVYGNSFKSIYSNCRLLASIDSRGTLPLSSWLSSHVWIENTPPDSFVMRHYQFAADNNNSTATARITLYFTQAEFDAYNPKTNSKLPANGNDAAGKANLLIEMRAGKSSDKSGLPITYAGQPQIINPDDKDIVWNTAYTRWEISFNTTGFGGYFVRTKNTPPNGLYNQNALPQSTLFPNPSEGNFYIYSGSSIETTFDIYDAQGRLVAMAFPVHNGINDFDFSTLVPGVYFIQLSNGERLKWTKL